MQPMRTDNPYGSVYLHMMQIYCPTRFVAKYYMVHKSKTLFLMYYCKQRIIEIIQFIPYLFTYILSFILGYPPPSNQINAKIWAEITEEKFIELLQKIQAGLKLFWIKCCTQLFWQSGNLGID